MSVDGSRWLGLCDQVAEHSALRVGTLSHRHLVARQQAAPWNTARAAAKSTVKRMQVPPGFRVELVAADLSGQPFTAPTTPYTPQSVAVLRLQLRCLSKVMTFAQLDIDSHVLEAFDDEDCAFAEEIGIIVEEIF